MIVTVSFTDDVGNKNKFAWFRTIGDEIEARRKFRNTYGYTPADAFKMQSGIVCGPLLTEATNANSR